MLGSGSYSLIRLGKALSQLLELLRAGPQRDVLAQRSAALAVG